MTQTPKQDGAAGDAPQQVKPETVQVILNFERSNEVIFSSEK